MLFSGKLASSAALSAIIAAKATMRKVYGAANIAHVIGTHKKNRRYGNTSRYRPHQGKQEMARRAARRGN